MDNDIRFRTIGRTSEFPAGLQRELEALTEASKDNQGMILCLALNYGGQSEIVDATRKLASEVEAGELRPEEIDEALFSSRLYDPEMPEVDLLVRTAGEFRISNFLLWQISYGEIFVSPALWPEFGEKELAEALDSFGNRERKFGGLARRVDA